MWFSKLFATSCEVGALITNKPKIYSNALNSFGMNLGMTFQDLGKKLEAKNSFETAISLDPDNLFFL